MKLLFGWYFYFVFQYTAKVVFLVKGRHRESGSIRGMASLEGLHSILYTVILFLYCGLKYMSGVIWLGLDFKVILKFYLFKDIIYLP